MKHSNWFVSRKQQAHQRNINVVSIESTKTAYDLHAVVRCKSCYGRGYIGRNLTTGEIVPCKCLTLKAKVEQTEAVVEETTKDTDGHSS